MTSLRGPVVALLACLALSQPAAAQRKYLIELGAAGGFLSLSDTTGLGTGPGGLARLGVWFPFRLSLEAEGAVFKPKTRTTSVTATVKTFTGSVLYNFVVGRNNSVYLKAGAGSTDYGTCPAASVPGAGPCGTAGTWLGGGGFRIAIVPTVMVRGEGVLNRNIGGSTKFSNFGANLGLSLMLGSKKTTDADGDGVNDSDDKCPGTPQGALVDKKGCPIDSDGDGVYDGLDRCPRTPAGAHVDDLGCPTDSDGDGVYDGLDKCPDTPLAAAVDTSGCPTDSDGDGVYDGLDRCPNTPRGATVDALGCPSDTDGDGVLDGLDRCPDTPHGVPVDASGCPAGQAPKPPAPGDRSAPRAPAPPRPHTFVLRDNAFAAGSARLRAGASVTLDSVAAVLAADPALRMEIGAYTAGSRAEADSRGFANLRVEAVRAYLIRKGTAPQRLLPKVYGSSQPLTADSSATGRAVNRRIEITPLPLGP